MRPPMSAFNPGRRAIRSKRKKLLQAASKAERLGGKVRFANGEEVPPEAVRAQARRLLDQQRNLGTTGTED